MNEPNFRQMFAEAFGELDAKQLWTLTKFAKRVRKFARNNSAFNNLANRSFPYASFRQVQKSRIDKVTQQTISYEGLQINVQGVETKEEEND